MIRSAVCVGPAHRGVADHIEGPRAGHLLGQPQRHPFGLRESPLGQPAALPGQVDQELDIVHRLTVADQH